MNGDAGRAELGVVERGHAPAVADGSAEGLLAVDPMVSQDRDSAGTHDPRPVGARPVSV